MFKKKLDIKMLSNPNRISISIVFFPETCNQKYIGQYRV